MLYLDYSREAGQWIPNQYGGNENLEAIDFSSALTNWLTTYHPGVLTIAEESTSWPGVSRPTYLGGLGFSLQVEHGLDERHAGATSRKTPIHRKYPPQYPDLQHDLRVHGELLFCRCPTTK